MFWWGFPVMLTGGVVFIIGIILTAIAGILDNDFDIPGIVFALIVSLDILGAGMAIIGCIFVRNAAMYLEPKK